MGMTKFLLFTGKHCKNCMPMKHNLDICGIKYEVVSTDTPDGAKMSTAYHVRALPTLVITLQNKPIDSFVGYLPVSVIEKLKEKYK